MTKQIGTLVEDIHEKVDKGFVINGIHMNSFLNDMKVALTRQMEPEHRQRGNHLRMSNIGKDDCQLWHEINGTEGEHLGPQTRLKFLFGDMVEALLLFLAKASGHEVTNEQGTLEIDGIVGHMDCEIDGVPTDIKSASSYGFKKFQNGSLVDDDPFGYIGQISSYAHARGKDKAAFFAMDKSNADLTVMNVVSMDMIDVPERIAHMKKVVASEEPPERAYTPVPHGESGNMKLGTKCSYCAFKDKCWEHSNDGKGLRLFIYGGGKPVWLTTVEREPKVFEKVSET